MANFDKVLRQQVQTETPHKFSRRQGHGFAPGASGNIVTEDLAFMLEAMGLRTGVNMEKLFAVRSILRQSLPEEALHGFTPDAGLPKGFVPATGSET